MPSTRSIVFDDTTSHRGSLRPEMAVLAIPDVIVKGGPLTID